MSESILETNKNADEHLKIMKLFKKIEDSRHQKSYHEIRKTIALHGQSIIK
jgi:hypothetical protein